MCVLSLRPDGHLCGGQDSVSFPQFQKMTQQKHKWSPGWVLGDCVGVPKTTPRLRGLPGLTAGVSDRNGTKRMEGGGARGEVGAQGGPPSSLPVKPHGPRFVPRPQLTAQSGNFLHRLGPTNDPASENLLLFLVIKIKLGGETDELRAPGDTQRRCDRRWGSLICSVLPSGAQECLAFTPQMSTQSMISAV